jgi:nucleoside-diphosphate-sugar epimerase
MKNKKILVTGGAGYVGSVLVDHLLKKGYKVKVLDNLMLGQTCHISSFSNKNYDFIKGDIRNKKTVKEALKGTDAIIHLAAIVGAPACREVPQLARETNVKGSKIINQLRSKDQPLIFASTGSVYGVLKDICTEESPVNPVSLYGKLKKKAEDEIMSKPNSVALRFATAFGVSPRIRYDSLMINNFVHEAIHRKQLIIYEGFVRRTFIHVQDMARSFIFILENLKKTRNEIYNVGSEKMNYTKKDIALKIKEKVPFFLHFAEVGEDEDKRDYEVSYAKIRKAGFQTKIGIDEGIDELIKAFRNFPPRKMDA